MFNNYCCLTTIFASPPPGTVGPSSKEIISYLSQTTARAQVYGYWRVRARGAGLARGSHRLGEPAHLRLDGVSEHAGDVVPPRVSVDRAAGFIIAVLLGPGVEQVADLPRRVGLYADPKSKSE